MRQLLPDNMALAERLEALPSHSPHLRPPETREIGSLPTWVSAFATYTAVVAEAHPQRVKDMLAYMRLIIREAMKYGGNGWATYDAVFRRNRAGPSAKWDELDPSLHIAYIAGQGEPSTPPCSSCNEADHTSEECALKPLQPRIKQPLSRDNPLPRVWSSPSRQSKRPAPLRKDSQPTKRVCISWNQGQCLFPGACSYRHVCASCQALHRARDCPLTPPESGFRRPRQNLVLMGREQR